jgi:hypothetical protein
MFRTKTTMPRTIPNAMSPAATSEKPAPTVLNGPHLVLCAISPRVIDANAGGGGDRSVDEGEA